MKLEITKRVEQRETIEISLPHYFKHDLMLDTSDTVIYGKIEEKRCTKIQIARCGTDIEIEISIEARPARQYGCCMTDEYASDEAEYLRAKETLLSAAQDA